MTPEEVLSFLTDFSQRTNQLTKRTRYSQLIVAIDLHRNRLSRIDEAYQKLGIEIIKAKTGHSTRPLPLLKGMEFDRILADVLCSGFERLRKNLDLMWKRKGKDIDRLSGFQVSMLLRTFPVSERGRSRPLQHLHRFS